MRPISWYQIGYGPNGFARKQLFILQQFDANFVGIGRPDPRPCANFVWET